MNSPAPLTASPSGSPTTAPTRTVPQKSGRRANRARPGSRTLPAAGPRAEVETNIILYTCTGLALACLPSRPDPRLSLEDAAHITGVHPEMLRYYCRLGLLDPRPGGLSGEPTFDNDALGEIGRIERYRRNLGVSRRALPLICQLRRDGERLQVKLAFLGDSWPEGAADRRT